MMSLKRNRSSSSTTWQVRLLVVGLLVAFGCGRAVADEAGHANDLCRAAGAGRQGGEGRVAAGPGAVAEGAGGGRHGLARPDLGQAWRRHYAADGEPEGYPPNGRLRLCPSRRLRPQARADSRTCCRHSRSIGRACLHLPSASRPQMVERRSLHDRGFPLLLGRCRQQQGAVARRPARADAGRRRSAEDRDHRRDDHPLQLVEAEPAVSAGPGRTEPALHLSTEPLSEAVPRQVCRTRTT